MRICLKCLGVLLRPTILFTALLMGFSFGCESPDTSINNKFNSAYEGNISIGEARDWFSTRLFVPSGRQAANQYQRDIDWHSAKIIKQPNNLEVVVAPIKYKTNDRPGVIFWDAKTPSNEKSANIDNVLDPKECLLIYKNKSGNMQSQLVQYIPSKKYQRDKKGRISDGDFTGLLFVMTWNEEILLGFEFKNGKALNNLTPSGKATGGRAANCDLYYYQNVVASCSSCGNNCTACNVIISGGYQGFCTSPSSDSGVDPNTGISYGGSGTNGTFTGSPYDQNFTAPYTFQNDANGDDDDKKKWFVYKLQGSIVVTNPCQHAALKEYLGIIPNIEEDYNNKVRQCLDQNSVSGDAIQNVLGSLTLSAIAREMYKRPWTGFLTVARGMLAGLTINGANATTCIWGVQGDIDAEINKAYNKYVQEFNKPCN